MPMLWELLAPAAMEFRLKGLDRYAVFRELVDKVPGLGDQDRATLLRSLAERERLGSTALGRGIALPHTRQLMAGVTRPLLVFGRSEGIFYGAMDGENVKLLFLLVSPGVSQHLQILSRLTRVLRDAQLRDELLKTAKAQAVIEALRQAEERAFARAEHATAR